LNKILSTQTISRIFTFVPNRTLDIILPELTALNQVEEIEGHTQKIILSHAVDNICQYR
jgi:tRNA nucleotidyltransferase (CCA-adding enzyme)